MPRKPPPERVPLCDDEPTELGFGLGGGVDPSELDDELDDEKTLPGLPRELDLFEDSSVSLGSSKVVLDPRVQSSGRFPAMAAAPEVSQGRWRDRTFVARGVMGGARLIALIEEAVKIASVQRMQTAVVRTALKDQLLPLLQQAIEQAGGDGIDAHLLRMANVPGRQAKDPLVSQLLAQMDRVNRAEQTKDLVAEAAKLARIVRSALGGPAPRRLSLKFLEQQFDGRIDLEALLSVLFSSDAELESRIEQVARTLDGLRVHALMANFARLKLEKRVLEGELSRRKDGR